MPICSRKNFYISDARQEGDYRELVEFAEEDATESVALAKDFLDEIKRLIKKTI